jgi:ADP-ribosyl-[dinitrogen reductase] hydrolase
MRLAAIPLFFSNSPETAIEKSGESSRTTHGAPAAINGCRYMGALVVGALNGASKQELLSDHFSPIPGYWDENPLVAQMAEIAAGSFTTKRTA